MYLFFKHTQPFNSDYSLPVRKTVPAIFHRHGGVKTIFHTIIWYISTRLNGGEYWFYELLKDNRVVSYAEVCTGHWQFPFIGYSRKNKFHIGPCYTIPEARGNGYYPMLLNAIMQDLGADKEYYMIVDSTNTASLRGVTKAGFSIVGKGIKNKIGQYIITESV